MDKDEIEKRLKAGESAIQDKVNYPKELDVYNDGDRYSIIQEKINHWQVKRIRSVDLWEVHNFKDSEWRCTCPAWFYKTGIDNNGHCKHIKAVQKTMKPIEKDYTTEILCDNGDWKQGANSSGWVQRDCKMLNTDGEWTYYIELDTLLLFRIKEA